MNGIKHESRVKAYGEVFTPDSTVNDMLDMWDNECKSLPPMEKLEKTFLEPACGNGNFLIRILDRKLKLIQQLPVEDMELNLIKAVSTIYGVDIQRDNVAESRSRMMEVIETGECEVFDLDGKEPPEFTKLGITLSPKVKKTIKHILDTNIQCGNTLTNKTESGEDLVVTEYTFREDGTVETVEYYMSDLSLEARRFTPTKYNSIYTREPIDDNIGDYL